jgi:hypothetical protein
MPTVLLIVFAPLALAFLLGLKGLGIRGRPLGVRAGDARAFNALRARLRRCG